MSNINGRLKIWDAGESIWAYAGVGTEGPTGPVGATVGNSYRFSIYLTYNEASGAIVPTNVINMVIASD
jgi:hypothetical protein